MITWKRVALLLVLSGFLGGCATRTVLEADVVGKCLQTRVDTHWADPPIARDWSRNRMLVVENVQPLYRGTFRYLDVIPAGAKFKVQRIEHWDRYGQSYLRIIAHMLDGEYDGDEFDLSACVPLHLPPMFTLGCTMDPNEIRFNPEFLKACE